MSIKRKYSIGQIEKSMINGMPANRLKELAISGQILRAAMGHSLTIPEMDKLRADLNAKYDERNKHVTSR